MKRSAQLKQIEHPLYGDNCEVYCYRGFQIWFHTNTRRAHIYKTRATTKVDGSRKVANGCMASVEMAVFYIDNNLLAK